MELLYLIIAFVINLNGSVDIPYNVHTPEIMVDSVTSLVNDQITINDNVIVTGATIINGRCNISNNLLVVGESELGETILIKKQHQKVGELYEFNLLLRIKNHLWEILIVVIYEQL